MSTDLHPQQLSDLEVASEMIRATTIHIVPVHVAAFCDMLIDQFETKFRRTLTVNRARQLVWRALGNLTESELNYIYRNTFEDLRPPFYSRTETIKELQGELTWKEA